MTADRTMRALGSLANVCVEGLILYASYYGTLFFLSAFR